MCFLVLDSTAWFVPIPSLILPTCSWKTLVPSLMLYSQKNQSRYAGRGIEDQRPQPPLELSDISLSNALSTTALWNHASHSGHTVPLHWSGRGAVRKSGQHPHRFRADLNPSSTYLCTCWCPEGQREAIPFPFCSAWISFWRKPRRCPHNILIIHSLQRGKEK